MTEGLLKLKKNSGGYRHYINTPDGGEHDLNCGTPIMVQLSSFNDDDEPVPGRWVPGRYEGILYCDEPKALFYFGYAYPNEHPLFCELPLYTKVKLNW
ncbi:MAG: hypothetical protein H0Z40_09565 [Desulfotomaculum sp.]|nr:hypothetical protein [Desulfotomaculum sp.]